MIAFVVVVAVLSAVLCRALVTMRFRCGYRPGCCPTCRGTGMSGDYETNGMCWDCRATGHCHDPDERF